MQDNPSIDIQDLPIKIKNHVNLIKMFDSSTCNVSVHWIILSRKKNIIKFGSSRAVSKGHQKSSIHAEEIAIKYCIKKKLNYKYDIIIWRWSKQGFIKPKECCSSCVNLAKKFNFTDRIFTITDGKIVSAITDCPCMSINNYIKFNNS